MTGVGPAPSVATAAAIGLPQERKRSRVVCLEEPLPRTIYQLMISQLYHDGYTDAADAVAASTGCVVADLPNRSGGRRLERLVANGMAVEATHAMELKSFHATEIVERYLSRAQLRLPAHMHAAQLKSTFAVGHMKERFVSSSLGGVIRCCVFSPDGSMVVVGGSNKVGARLFSLETIFGSMNLSDLRSTNTLTALSEEPTTDAAQQPPSGAIHANTATSLAEARYFTKHRLTVEAAKFHPTEPLMVTGGREGDVYMWSYRNPTGVDMARTLLQDTYPVRSLDISPSGDYALIATDHNVIRLSSLEEGGSNQTLPASVHTAALSDVAFRNDGRVFATSSFDGSISTTDFVSGKATLHIQKAHSGVPVTSVCFSRSGNLVLTYGMDACARLWDLRRIGSHPSGATTASGVGALLTVQPAIQSGTSASGLSGGLTHVGAAGSSDAPVPAAVQVQSFGVPSKCEHRVRAKFNSHESLIVTQDCSLNAVHSYDVYSGELVYSCAVAQHAQRAFATHPFSPLLVTGGDDCRLRLWTLSTLP